MKPIRKQSDAPFHKLCSQGQLRAKLPRRFSDFLENLKIDLSHVRQGEQRKSDPCLLRMIDQPADGLPDMSIHDSEPDGLGVGL
jgi:hypothetical protein